MVLMLVMQDVLSGFFPFYVDDLHVLVLVLVNQKHLADFLHF